MCLAANVLLQFSAYVERRMGGMSQEFQVLFCHATPSAVRMMLSLTPEFKNLDIFFPHLILLLSGLIFNTNQ